MAISRKKKQYLDDATMSVENAASTATAGRKTYRILGNMKVNRYYSSILESTAKMSGDALTLLDREDYVGFFKTCGTTYIRR